MALLFLKLPPLSDRRMPPPTPSPIPSGACLDWSILNNALITVSGFMLLHTFALASYLVAAVIIIHGSLQQRRDRLGGTAGDTDK